MAKLSKKKNCPTQVKVRKKETKDLLFSNIFKNHVNINIKSSKCTNKFLITLHYYPYLGTNATINQLCKFELINSKTHLRKVSKNQKKLHPIPKKQELNQKNKRVKTLVKESTRRKKLRRVVRRHSWDGDFTKIFPFARKILMVVSENAWTVRL